MLYLGREAGQIDRALAEYGMKRAVVLSLQPWISAAFAVANSDWIATVRYGLARYLAERIGTHRTRLESYVTPLYTQSTGSLDVQPFPCTY
jgi:hypothetical protein